LFRKRRNPLLVQLRRIALAWKPKRHNHSLELVLHNRSLELVLHNRSLVLVLGNKELELVLRNRSLELVLGNKELELARSMMERHRTCWPFSL